jgi:hypothetical protein
VLARAAAGLSDRTIASDVLHLEQVRLFAGPMNKSQLLCVLVVMQDLKRSERVQPLDRRPDTSQAGERWRQSYSAWWF